MSDSPTPSIKWPDELTGDLSDILGRQCFTFIHWTQAFRLAGFEIPNKAEAEQAFCLHRLLGHWFNHGSMWRVAAEADLRDVFEKAKAARATLKDRPNTAKVG